MHNNRNGVVFLYPDNDGKGERACIEVDEGSNLIGFEDVTSSVKLTRRAECPEV